MLNTKIIDGKKAELITERNIDEFRKSAQRIGVYGDGIAVGNYIYTDRCGYDTFFVTVKG